MAIPFENMSIWKEHFPLGAAETDVTILELKKSMNRIVFFQEPQQYRLRPTDQACLKLHVNRE